MDQTTDFSLFPKAYGILASERSMHPVDLADCSLKIDSSSQLFLDDYLIAECSCLTREIHRPRPFEQNPGVVPELP